MSSIHCTASGTPITFVAVAVDVDKKGAIVSSSVNYLDDTVAAKTEDPNNKTFLLDESSISSFSKDNKWGAFSFRMDLAIGGMLPFGNESANVNSLWLHAGNISAPLV